jgi:hypothetical protein
LTRTGQTIHKMTDLLISFTEMRAFAGFNDGKQIIYRLTPSIAKNPTWSVEKTSHDNHVKIVVDDINDYLTEQDDIYGPNEIRATINEETITFRFQHVLEHYMKRERVLEGDEFDTDNYNWTCSNMFMDHCGVLAIIKAHRNRAIKRFNKEFLADKECPVSREPLVAGDTFKLPCEHLISRDSLMKLQGEKKCPLCRAGVEGRLEII